MTTDVWIREPDTVVTRDNSTVSIAVPGKFDGYPVLLSPGFVNELTQAGYVNAGRPASGNSGAQRR